MNKVNFGAPNQGYRIVESSNGIPSQFSVQPNVANGPANYRYVDGIQANVSTNSTTGGNFTTFSPRK